MTTQVIFKIDKKLKDKAMKKAQNEGIAFASILKLATKAFVENQLDIGLVTKDELNPRMLKILERESKEIDESKNISKGFNNAKDAISYLKSL